jgi:hypothetical protein
MEKEAKIESLKIKNDSDSSNNEDEENLIWENLWNFKIS